MVIRGKRKVLITFGKIGPRSSWEALTRKGQLYLLLDSWFQNLGGCLQSWLPAQPDVRKALEVISLVFKSLDRLNSLGDSGLIDPRVDPQEAPRLSHHTPVVVASLHLITVSWVGNGICLLGSVLTSKTLTTLSDWMKHDFALFGMIITWTLRFTYLQRNISKLPPGHVGPAWKSCGCSSCTSAPVQSPSWPSCCPC